MGFFSAILKTVLLPVVVVKDATNILTGEETDSIDELTEDIKDEFDDI